MADISGFGICDAMSLMMAEAARLSAGELWVRADVFAAPSDF